MIRTGVIGATGYGSRELIRLLCIHPDAELTAAVSSSAAGDALSSHLPGFAKLIELDFESFDPAALAEKCDVVFIGVPGRESMEPAAKLLEAGVKVIDMGPDFRLTDTDAFKTYYNADHAYPDLLENRAYGMVPFHRDAIKSASLVAVPGCYPLGAIVPLWPLVPAARPDVPVIIDSISGVSGAGKSLAQPFHFPEMNENVRAYKLGVHQHTPEIEQELNHAVQVQFTPHVGPFTRGILSTITIRPTESVNLDEIYSCYADEPFIRVLGEGAIPDLNQVHGSNFCDFGWHTDTRTGNLILVSAIDNLVGGTAGMAVQCMNLMFGLDETSGLSLGGMTI